MKKQNLKSLKLKKNTISNFSSEEINGGVLSGIHCALSNNCVGEDPTNMCDRTIMTCPPLTYTCYLTSYCRTQAAC